MSKSTAESRSGFRQLRSQSPHICLNIVQRQRTSIDRETSRVCWDSNVFSTHAVLALLRAALVAFVGGLGGWPTSEKVGGWRGGSPCPQLACPQLACHPPRGFAKFQHCLLVRQSSSSGSTVQAFDLRPGLLSYNSNRQKTRSWFSRSPNRLASTSPGLLSRQARRSQVPDNGILRSTEKPTVGCLRLNTAAAVHVGQSVFAIELF